MVGASAVANAPSNDVRFAYDALAVESWVSDAHLTSEIGEHLTHRNRCFLGTFSGAT